MDWPFWPYAGPCASDSVLTLIPARPLPAELLERVNLVHKPVSLQPRGLINRGNWCYINAVSLAAPGWGH